MNCPPDKILNPKSNRCVSKTSVIGKKLLLLNKRDLKASIIKHLTTIRNYENINKNKFKALAYSKVLNQLYNYKEVINDYDDFIKNIQVGDRIALKVKQLIEDGVIKYEEEKIKKDSNFKFQLELKKIYGIGEAKIKELIDNNIKSITDLEKNKHLLNKNQLIGLKYYKELNERIPLDEYIKHKKILEKDLKKIKYEFVGSFRRGNSSMGDIDILIMKDDNFNLNDYISKLKKLGYIKEILAIGNLKFGGIVKLDDTSPARKLDILICPQEEFYYSLLHFTGSAEFNVGLRDYLKNKYGLSLSEHGFKDRIIRIPEMNSEKDIFDFFNLNYVEPSKRKIFFNPQK
jgi:DNA polymerase/3'-5' exonuclease PolX